MTTWYEWHASQGQWKFSAEEMLPYWQRRSYKMQGSDWNILLDCDTHVRRFWQWPDVKMQGSSYDTLHKSQHVRNREHDLVVKANHTAVRLARTLQGKYFGVNLWIHNPFEVAHRTT